MMVASYKSFHSNHFLFSLILRNDWEFRVFQCLELPSKLGIYRPTGVGFDVRRERTVNTATTDYKTELYLQTNF